MKKLLFFGALACSLAFYACKKNEAKIDDTEQPPKIDTINMSDRSVFATKVRVAYGIYTKGAIPAATVSEAAPALIESKTIVNAISGRYIVLKPAFDHYQSTVKGFYVSINGSGSHFKVDYQANRSFRQAPGMPQQLFREGDYVDSSIIMKLPPYIVGDTLTLTYAAYDSLGNTSNHVQATARVYSQNGVADYQDFVGIWKVNRKTDANGQWQNYYIPDTARTAFVCNEGKVSYCLDGRSCFDGIAAITGVTKYDLMFTDANEYTELFSASASRVMLDNSTCDQLAYGTQTLTKLERGGWSFDANSKIMTIVVDGNGYEYDNAYSYQVKILEMTPQMIKIIRLDNSSYQVELVKKQ